MAAFPAPADLKSHDMVSVCADLDPPTGRSGNVTVMWVLGW